MRIFTSTATTHSPVFSPPSHRTASVQPLRRHIEWHSCLAADALRHADMLKLQCMRICEEFRLNVLGNAFFQFEPSGVAGTILLQDSHIAFQTWPDKHRLTAELSFSRQQNNAALLLEQLALHMQPGNALQH